MEHKNIDDYIAQFSPYDIKRMQQLRTLIKKSCPLAEERMYKEMPTFLYCGIELVHFIKRKHHITLYLSHTSIMNFCDRLEDIVYTKSTIRLQDDKKIPTNLLQDMLMFCSNEIKQQVLHKQQQATWTLHSVMKELKKLGSDQTKHTYMRHGAKEPVFGVLSKDLKPLMKKTGKHHALAMQLYATGNYDAMYFAGMMAQPKHMNKEDVEEWMRKAYCQAIADYTVAITLAQTTFAQDVADEWIHHKEILYQSCAWTCYSCMLSVYADEIFDKDKMKEYLAFVEQSIHLQSDIVRYAMNAFVIALSISYQPLHKEAYESAQRIGKVNVDMGNTNCQTPFAQVYIEKAIKAGKIGYKRRKMRC